MKYLTAMEAARRLGVNEKTVRLWIKSGTYNLTAHHPGGAKNRLAIAEADIERIKRERAQYQSGPQVEEQPDISGLITRIEELERKYAEMERAFLMDQTLQLQRNERRIAPAYVPAGTNTGSDEDIAIKRAYKRPTTDDLPEGYLTVSDFAALYGVPRTTVKHHISKGFMNKDGSYDKIIAEARPRPGHADQTQYYFSPEQQRQALAFWDKHAVKYSKPIANP